MKTKNKQQFKRTIINKRIFLISIAILIFGLLFNQIRHSLFIIRPDRLNLVFYGRNVVFYSLDLKNKIHYRINLPSDIRMKVPGGYGEYRAGSLGKLIRLEKKPQLLQKTFSAVFSNFTHIYFYPDSDLIYQNQNKNFLLLPSINQLVTYKSNAGWFDRLYLFILFFFQEREINQNIASLVITDKDNDLVWQREKFANKYLGYWYSKNLRQERANVAIIYQKNYRTALLLSNIIEGNGIKIVDLSENLQQRNNIKCQVDYNNIKVIKTVDAIVNFFQCSKNKVETGSVDIIVRLNSLEKDWEIE